MVEFQFWIMKIVELIRSDQPWFDPLGSFRSCSRFVELTAIWGRQKTFKDWSVIDYPNCPALNVCESALQASILECFRSINVTYAQSSLHAVTQGHIALSGYSCMTMCNVSGQNCTFTYQGESVYLNLWYRLLTAPFTKSVLPSCYESHPEIFLFNKS